MLIESKSFSDITLDFVADDVTNLLQDDHAWDFEHWIQLDRDDAIRVATEILRKWKPEALR